MAGDQKTAWQWWELLHPAKCRKHRASVWYGNCWPAVNVVRNSDTWLWIGASLGKGPGWGRGDYLIALHSTTEFTHTFGYAFLHAYSLTESETHARMSHLITVLLQYEPYMLRGKATWFFSTHGPANTHTHTWVPCLFWELSHCKALCSISNRDLLPLLIKINLLIWGNLTIKIPMLLREKGIICGVLK